MQRLALHQAIRELKMMAQFYSDRGFTEKANEVLDLVARMEGQRTDDGSEHIHQAQPRENELQH